MLKHILAVSALALSTGGTAFAQDAGRNAPTTSENAETAAERLFIRRQSADQVLAEALIGAHVVDVGGSEIGTVEDMILNGDQGKAVGYVVSIGGMLGFGDKQVGIPFARAEIASTGKGDGKVLRLDISRDELDSAPEFKDAAAQNADAGRGAGSGAGGGYESRM